MLSHVFHFGNYFFYEITINLLRIKIPLELLVTQFISTFELAVIIKFLLDCIIGQMYIPVGYVFSRELSATSSEVSFLVPVTLHIAIDSAHHCEASYVKLSILVQQRLFDVLLNDVTPFVPIHIRVQNQVFNTVKVFADINATPSVGVLARLDDPNVFTKLRVLVKYGFFVIIGVIVELFEFKELRVV